MKKQSRAWSAEARLQFIEFRLYWEGRINRADLISHFGISVPQSSLDLRSYLELAPGNVEYDSRRKAYFATSSFKPVLTTPNARDYLAQLEMLQAEQDSPFSHRSFVSVPPSFDIAPFPERVVDPQTLKRVLHAIRERRALHMEYQSMNRPEPIWRWISPHAIGSDGFRWHIRAYCYENNKFIDFVFGRILAIGESKDSEVDPSEDSAWNNWIELTIGPNPSLAGGPRRVIELDYGMVGGLTKLIVREALSSYLKKRLGLIANIASSEAAHEDKQAGQQHIVLIREERVSARS